MRLRNKFVFSFLVPAILIFVAACGDETAVNETIGPKGPTTSGYYFNFTLTPTALRSGETMSINVQIWDGSTDPWVPLSGGTVSIAGAGTVTGELTSDSEGSVLVDFAPSGGTGYSGQVTATVQNKSLTIAYQIAN